ncbi:MAG: replication-associated recombination protein A, partial [Deltaproteobacteria bacterium]|nr:replication-associated recombination protein A [Deltaproteobacteria bacterium]
VQKSLSDPRGLAEYRVRLDEKAAELLVQSAYGDARRVLNALEAAAFLAVPDDKGERLVTPEIAAAALQRKILAHDKDGESHFNIISALHKSLRGSDPDAAVYWLARLLEAGEDPLYPARRMVRFASEDVGNADPRALVLAMSAVEAYRLLGSPEGELALFQLAAYLACAPKSNASYLAEKRAREAVRTCGALPVPLHLRNAPTRLMKEAGYGKEYLYPHDFPSGWVDQDYLPEGMDKTPLYQPVPRGEEKRALELLEVLRTKKSKRRKDAKQEEPDPPKS